MRIYIILGLIFNVITIPAHGMETKKIKPLGIKNFPVDELNLDGLCAHIAKFQILNAGLHALNAEYKVNGNNNLLWIMTQRYKQQQEKQNDTRFTFNNGEIKEINDVDSQYKYFNKYYSSYSWGNNENKDSVIAHEIPTYSKPQDLDLFLANILKEYSSYNQKPLVTIELNHHCGNREQDSIKTIEELQHIKAPTFQSTYAGYKLVGVVQLHNYSLKKQKFYHLEEKLGKIFFKLPSGRFFINTYNPEWKSHIDAYVNYNNTWYVMDDETRWEASSKEKKETDAVTKALIHCYPGIPVMLAYAPIDISTHNSNAITSDTNNSKKYSLTLKRDTKTPSLLKSLLVLLGGALCDGLAVGGAVFLEGCVIDYALEEQFASKQTIKIASIFGLITGCLSFAYHGRRIIPMHSSQVTYDSESPHKELGPRDY